MGLLSSLSPTTITKAVAAIYAGLKEQGFVEGQNLKTEQRWAEGHYERLPAMAKELVDLKVAAIVTIGGNIAALPAKAATTTIPIVFATANDPVATGLVTNFVRPSGNLTGVTWMGADLLAKDLEVFHELLPNVPVFGIMLNPDRPDVAAQLKSAEEAAAKIGRQNPNFERQECRRDRCRLCNCRPGAHWRSDRGPRRAVQRSSRTDRDAGSEACGSGAVLSAGVRRRRRSDELRQRPDRLLSSNRPLHWPHSQGREAW